MNSTNTLLTVFLSAVICLLALSELSLNAQTQSRKSTRVERMSMPMPVVNGQNVAFVEYALNGKAAGTFTYSIETKNWQEQSFKDSISYTFVEKARDEWSVYLYDKSRNVNIQLDLHTKKVMYSAGSKPKIALYDIVSSQEGQIVEPTALSSVNFGRDGKLLGKYQKSGASPFWSELDVNGKENYTFEELNRDEWSVYLYDKSRNVYLQIDLHRKKVIYREGNGPERPLYDFVSNQDVAEPDPIDVSTVSFGKDGKFLGRFEKNGASKSWSEKNVKGELTYTFAELERDEWSVYLIDKTRDVKIQLDLHTKKVMYNQGSAKQIALYDIVPMQDFEEAEPTSVSSVNFGKDGKRLGMYKKNGASPFWSELDVKGKLTYSFEEKSRDQWSVYLYDKSRDVHIQLDLHTKKVMYNKGKESAQAIYDLIQNVKPTKIRTKRPIGKPIKKL